MRKAKQLNERQVRFRFLKEAEHNERRALAERRILTATQKKSLLRGGLESWAWMVNT